LVIFIAIVSIAVVGVLQVISLTTRHSADPQSRKQALAIAEALLEEVQLMPFTTCDPDGYDAIANTCAAGFTETIGPEAGEVRGSLTSPFDNVNDYNNFQLVAGGTDLSGLVTAPAGYSAGVVITQDGSLGPAGSRPPQASALRITVTVTYPGGTLQLEGYRTQYAPIATP
jgi:MSHA pilin protein MshD